MGKNWRWISLFTIAFFFLVGLNAPVLGAGETGQRLSGQDVIAVGTVSDSARGLNVRAEPTSRSEQIGRLDHDDVFEIVDTSQTYYQIVYGDGYGYVYGPLVKLVEGLEGYVAARVKGLNVRAEASSNSEQIGRLSPGEKMMVVNTTGTYYKIKVNERYGYVYGAYVTIGQNEVAQKLIAQAHALLGVPYRFGGETPEGFDPSGFIQYLFNDVKIPLPRAVKEQFRVGEPIPLSQLEPGDVLFFSRNMDGNITHNGLYIGNNQFIHVAQSSGVTLQSLEEAYWRLRYTEARRYYALREVEPPEGLESLFSVAYQLLGAPYLFGGTTPEGFDCSGFVRYVFRESLEIYLPRDTEQQWAFGEAVSGDQLQPGDVLFFKDTWRPGISHNAIYLGEDKMIHAVEEQGVRVDYFTADYWQSKYAGARRYVSIENPLVNESLSYLGVPYKTYGDQPDGFDSSGFVQYLYRKVYDVALPRSYNQMRNLGRLTESPQVGDLLFFSTQMDGVISHVGLYIGYGQFIHASVSEGITLSSLTSAYWSPRFIESRTVDPELLDDFQLQESIVVETAKQYLGVPFLSGGRTPEGFNAPGFVSYVFHEAKGIELPHTTAGLWNLEGEPVDLEELQPEDLVFFHNEQGEITHVAIYIGNDQLIHATVSNGVTITYLENSVYWSGRYHAAKRLTHSAKIKGHLR